MRIREAFIDEASLRKKPFPKKIVCESKKAAQNGVYTPQKPLRRKCGGRRLWALSVLWVRSTAGQAVGCL
jgi:hypothetical protein